MLRYVWSMSVKEVISKTECCRHIFSEKPLNTFNFLHICVQTHICVHTLAYGMCAFLISCACLDVFPNRLNSDESPTPAL